ncbi:MAG: hypothetical protein ACLUKN_07690 [Bacilli bacterium]
MAGGGVRAVWKPSALRTLSKSLGSNNDMAMVNATLNALTNSARRTPSML